MTGGVPAGRLPAIPAQKADGSPMASVLLVDDDRDFCELLSTYLTTQGLAVDVVHKGDAALEHLKRTDRPRAVCLDFMMPSPNGLEVLRRLRAANDWIPVLILTANTDETDRIVGLELGADDYVNKTSSPRELAARLKALIRRADPELTEGVAEEDRPIEIDGLALVPSERRAHLSGHDLSLTATEFGVLHYLMRHAGTVISKDDLSRSVLGRRLTPYDRALDVHISHIRKKLAGSETWRNRIQAVRGVGYQLLALR